MIASVEKVADFPLPGRKGKAHHTSLPPCTFNLPTTSERGLPPLMDIPARFALPMATDSANAVSTFPIQA